MNFAINVIIGFVVGYREFNRIKVSNTKAIGSIIYGIIALYYAHKIYNQKYMRYFSNVLALLAPLMIVAGICSIMNQSRRNNRI